MENKKLEENILLNHKYNFYQQFFVISIDPKIMSSINYYELKNLLEPYSSPKVISKYPYTDLPYLIIPDSIISSHCFPQGIINEIIEYENENDLLTKEKKTENFIFCLENMSPEIKSDSLRTNKVYYTCLLFYENIENYRKCINQRKYFNNSDNNEEEIKNKGLLIPKVICLSSFAPFYEKTKFILHRIRNYVNNFNYNNKSENNLNINPIEKIIEGLIFSLPAIPRGEFSIKLNNDSFSYKRVSDNISTEGADVKEIIFHETQPNTNPRETFNYSILMNFFKFEEIFELIKFIILEEPIIFFSEDKESLTNVIECLISLIYPLEYPYPVIPILPEQNYSLISLFKHFIIGINYKYSEDIWSKKIILDGVKFLHIIRLEKRFNKILNSDESDHLGYQVFTSLKVDENKPLIKFEQTRNNAYKIDKEETRAINEKKKINLPRHYLEKCCRKLEKTCQEQLREIELKYIHKDKKIINRLKIKAFNTEIREEFLYFFCCILLKYQEYCVKYEKKIYEVIDNQGNNIEKEFEERNIQLEEKYYNHKIKLEDIFNAEEFINSTPSLDRSFYRVFFGTRIFFKFMLKKIFPDSNQDKLDILYFDEIINKKLSRELYNQKKETKFLEFELKNLKKEIEIDSLKKQIDNNVKQYLQKKENRAKALNYFQYIYLNGEDSNNKAAEKNSVVENKTISFYYYVFPILLNDGIFYNEKYKNINNDNKNIKIWSYFEYSTFSQESRRLYDIFEKESTIIIENEEIENNYKIYDYSLNPTSQYLFKNEFLIKILWITYLSRTFKSIPFNKKRYYFELLMNFVKKNKEIIDINTFLLVFNSINKNGDRNMNQEYFPYLKIKTYTAYLCAREKMKSENNFIKYIMNQEKENNTSNNNLKSNLKKKKNLKNDDNKDDERKKDIDTEKDDSIFIEKKIFIFNVNSFCTANKGDKNEVCNEPFSGKISDFYSDQEDFIKFKCNKCGKEQILKIMCKYNDQENKENYLKNYIINFQLLSPITLLRQNWLKNNLDLNPSFIYENYLEYYLSAIFYFYEQNLPCIFLMPEFSIKTEILTEEKNIYYSIVDGEEFFDEKKIKKVIVPNTPIKEGFVIFEELAKQDAEDLEIEINGKTKEEEDSVEIEKMLQIREDARKKGFKSSFKKNNTLSCKKKTVEFKLDPRTTNYSEEC